MKYAIVRGKKAEARKNAIGYCQACDAVMIPKCGEVKLHHWAHKGKLICDHWWENETEWHRNWKNKFPVEWQEVVHKDEHGEKHIADVKTPSGWALEFQHSFLNPEERRSRNAFYQKLVWVVDGTRRSTDRKQFDDILSDPLKFKGLPFLKVQRPEVSRLIKEWHASNVLVFFDFKTVNDSEDFPLWFLFPKLSANHVHLLSYSRAEFIKLQNANKFDEFLNLISVQNQRLIGINKEVNLQIREPTHYYDPKKNRMVKKRRL